MKTLLPHQRDAYAYAKDRDGIALFMDPRTGKTLPAIRWASDDDGLVLVTAPKSVVPNWVDEIIADGHEAEAVLGSSAYKLELIDGMASFGVRWFVTNPEAIVTCPDIIRRFPWTTWIVDESTVIRNPRARVTKTFLKLSRGVPRRAVLTGLANPASPADFFCQMVFAFGSFQGHNSFWKWRYRWMSPGPFSWEVPARHRDAIKRAVHEDAFVLTAEQAGIKMRKVYQTRRVDMPAKLKGLYGTVEADWAADGAATKYSVKKETWLAQLASGIVSEEFDSGPAWIGTKTDELSRFVRELGSEPFIVWGRFTEECQRAQTTLQRAGIRTTMIDGSVPVSDRQRLRLEFQAGKWQAIVCQPLIASMGLDFSRASIAIFLSNYWDLSIRAQCLERTNHPIKRRRRPTLVVDIVSAGTVDEIVVRALKRKWKSSREFLKYVRGR